MRHKDEFFRKINIPKELENKKEDIFHLSNIHYQTEYFRLEAEKWKIYVVASNNNKKRSVEKVERMETTTAQENDSIPIARPSPTGLSRPPGPLDLSEFAEIFDEWLPAPTPGQKRKLAHRQDDPPTPPSPRQPPPIIPRRSLPPRDSNAPLRAGSLRSSPFEIDTTNNIRRQHSFNSLLPLEKQIEIEQQEHIRTPTIVVAPANVASIIISPMHSSTPEPILKSPSAIPKTDITPHSSYSFSIIPIECRYYFKQIKQRCTFETIKNHQEFLENKYKTLEDERENKLCSSFSEEERRQVVELIKSINEKSIENKKNEDKKRLDNLLLDQMREQAAVDIKQIGSQLEQEYVQKVHSKFTRILDLKLQLDKLEKRFVENMPPPSLNIFDKIELHAKGLKPDNSHLQCLREQWKNTLRKAKLDLTSLMRQAKVAEIEEANKEYEELTEKIAEHLHEPYDILCHVSRTRHNQVAKKKLNFLEKRACIMNVN